MKTLLAAFLLAASAAACVPVLRTEFVQGCAPLAEPIAYANCRLTGLTAPRRALP